VKGGEAVTNRVVVTVEGGVVQSVVADRPDELDVVVLDYDTQGADEDGIEYITQPDGSKSDAVVIPIVTEHPRISLDEVFGKASAIAT
jgi:hypothetical protein